MKQLAERIDRLIKKEKLPWERSGYAVQVFITKGARKQRVTVVRNQQMYEFSSIVLRNAMIKNDCNRNDIAYSAFRKNALKELVNFTFDKNGNLIGLITQPAEFLDDEELRLYIDVVAQECDRFEYKLTGDDKE